MRRFSINSVLPRHPIWRFMVMHWVLGMGVGAALAGGLLAFDVGHLRTLMAHSDVLLVAGFLFVASFAFSFGGLFCATAVMGMKDEGAAPGPRLRALVPIILRRSSLHSGRSR